MRIAQVAPLFEAVPPKLYGGTERVVHWITEALVEQGHNVTLFASGDSQTSAKLVPVWPQALRLAPVADWNATYALLVETVAQRAHEFDVLHFHIDYWPNSVFLRLGVPFVTTLHGRLDLPEFKVVYAKFPDVPIVSISDNQRKPVPNLGWAGTVYHGMPANLLTPQPTGADKYFAFLGRISPEKGIVDAIRIARACNTKLKIAAKIGEEDLPFHEEIVAPLLEGPDIEFIGEIDDSHKPAFLSGAKALLFPIAWPEPFGLVMIEAMACGTPVIAFRRGSVPEVIENGVTGFIVDDMAGAIEAAKKIDTIDRAGVRKRFEQRFTNLRMADDYMAIYKKLIAAKKS